MDFMAAIEIDHNEIGPFEWLFSSSTFFTFCYILPDWLLDFFPSSTKRDGKIHRQIFVE